MIIKTRVFEFHNNGYKNLTELAQAMEISTSQVYRVRQGTRQINQKFIIGAARAFPNHKLADLFYLVPESPGISSAEKGHIDGIIYRGHGVFLPAH